MNHQRYILLQLWLFSMLLGSSAQTTIYGIRQNDRFLSHKTKYVLNDDDALEFQSNRFYVVRADGTRQSQSYGVVVGREVQSFAGDAVGCSFDFSIDLQLLME